MMNWLGFGSREPACRLKELIVKTGRAVLVSSSLLAFVGWLDLNDQQAWLTGTGRARDKTATSREINLLVLDLRV
jgi:hypothetical protein